MDDLRAEIKKAAPPLAATFQIYSQLGIPLAIGIGTMLLAGLTLLPALLAVFGRAAFWPSQTRAGTGKAGLWGRIATRMVRRPAVPLTIGVIVFGALASAVTAYQPGGFGGSITAPAGTDSAAGTALLAKHFPASAANPTNLIYKLPQLVWDNPESVVVATSQLKASGLFTGVTGPLNPAGVILTPAQYQSLHATLGDPRALPPLPPVGSSVPLAAYEAYRATAQYVSPDGETIQFQTGLKAGDPSTTAAMNAVPSIRAEAAAVAKTLHATAYGVGGEAPAFYDISAISDSDLFSVFALVGGRGSGGSQVRAIGVGLALGVLMDTFIVRTILVPCTVVLLGRWNWWPSKLSRTGPQPGGPGEEGTERDAEPAAPRAADLA